MASTKSLVTVGMCVHNGEKFVAEAVVSALNQTHDRLELLVFDDGSSDDSVAEVLGVSDDRVRLIRSEVNIGLAGGRERLRGEATGGYIVWLDCDDRYEPDRLEVLLGEAQSTGADIVIDSYRLTTHEGIELDCTLSVPDSVAQDPHFTRLFERNKMLPHPLIARSCFESVPFDVSLRFSEDYDYWLKCIGTTGLRYRLTDGQMSSDHRKAREYTARILRKYSVAGIRRLYRERGYSDESADYMCCLQHIYRGDYGSALEAAFQPWPDEPGVDQSFYQGTLLLHAGRLGEARAHLDAHLARTPNSPAGLNNMGVLVRSEGGEGRAWFESALRLLPSYLDATENLSSGEAVTDTQILWNLVLSGNPP